MTSYDNFWAELRATQARFAADRAFNTRVREYTSVAQAKSDFALDKIDEATLEAVVHELEYERVMSPVILHDALKVSNQSRVSWVSFVTLAIGFILLLIAVFVNNLDPYLVLAGASLMGSTPLLFNAESPSEPF